MWVKTDSDKLVNLDSGSVIYFEAVFGDASAEVSLKFGCGGAIITLASGSAEHVSEKRAEIERALGPNLLSNWQEIQS